MYCFLGRCGCDTKPGKQVGREHTSHSLHAPLSFGVLQTLHHLAVSFVNVIMFSILVRWRCDTKPGEHVGREHTPHAYGVFSLHGFRPHCVHRSFSKEDEAGLPRHFHGARTGGACTPPSSAVHGRRRLGSFAKLSPGVELYGRTVRYSKYKFGGWITWGKYHFTYADIGTGVLFLLFHLFLCTAIFLQGMVLRKNTQSVCTTYHIDLNCSLIGYKVLSRSDLLNMWTLSARCSKHSGETY